MDGSEKQNGSEDTGRESSAPIDFVLDEGCAGVSSALQGARKAETSHKDEEFFGRMENMADMWGIAYEDIGEAIDILVPIESLESVTASLDFLTECIGIWTKTDKKELALVGYSAVYLCQTEGWPLPKASEFIYKYHQLGVLKEVYEAMLKTNAEEVESQFQHANNDFDQFGLGEFKNKKGNDYIPPGKVPPEGTYFVQAFKLRLLGFHRYGEPRYSNGTVKYVTISYERLDESGTKHRSVAFWVGEVEKQSGDEVEDRSESDREATRKEIELVGAMLRGEIDESDDSREEFYRRLEEEDAVSERELEERRSKMESSYADHDPETYEDILESLMENDDPALRRVAREEYHRLMHEQGIANTDETPPSTKMSDIEKL